MLCGQSRSLFIFLFIDLFIYLFSRYKTKTGQKQINLDLSEMLCSGEDQGQKCHWR